jgi:ribosomal protein S18 acetylase RimI-like enzyme
MIITNCTQTDLPQILNLYEHARELQQRRKMVVWPDFSERFILNEIDEERQFKIVINNDIACNWAITFNDKEIWENRDRDDSIYIHRICTNRDYRGNRYIDNIVDWAKKYAIEKNKKYIRIDTLGNNTKLIEHYTSAGFDFLGIFKLTNTSALPKHYQDEPNCCLFQWKL